MTRREVDIGTPELGVEFKDNIGTVLAFRIGNVLHLRA